MEIEVLKPVKVDVAAIRCVMAVRYDEEDMPNDFPFRRGDVWDITVDIDTGIIRDWPAGREADISMKVCDEGSYYLLGRDGSVIAERESDYVPSCIPGRYGDYVDFVIDGTGKVSNWKPKPETLKEFFPED